MGDAIRLLVNFPSTEAFNLSDFLIFGEADCRLFSIPGLQRSPEISRDLHRYPAGWGSTGAANSNDNPGASTITGIWGGIFC